MRERDVGAKRTGAALDPGVQKFVDGVNALGGPPIYELSPDDARKVLVTAQASAKVDKAPAVIEDRTIAAGPTGKVDIRIVRPEGTEHEVLPVIVYIHGGGWVLGDKETHDRLVRELANGAHAAIVFVDYARSPEAKYPVAIEQAYAAMLWVVEHAKELWVDPSRLAVAGDSVGGNMTAAVTLLAKERGGPAIRFQAMFYPVTDARMNTASYEQFADGPWLTRAGMKWFWDSYLPDVSMRERPTASPLRASLEQLRGLPPALLITDENDVLRDEGEAYAHKLSQAGVRVAASRQLGTLHDFMLLNGIADTPATRAAVEQASDTLRQELHA
jgi:acetyl esterase